MPNIGSNRIKLLLAGAVLFLVIAIVIIISIILLDRRKGPRQKASDAFVEYVKMEIIPKSDSKNTTELIEQQLSIIKNINLSDKQRYDATIVLLEYLSNEYSITNDPSIRLIAKNVVGKYAKEQFPRLYNESRFDFACVDPQCGMDLSPEIKQALNIIEKSNLSEGAKVTISENLKSAGYTPESNLQDKLFGLQLSISQLEEYGDPVGSDAAKLLKKYLLDKYKTEYSRDKFQ